MRVAYRIIPPSGRAGTYKVIPSLDGTEYLVISDDHRGARYDTDVADYVRDAYGVSFLRPHPTLWSFHKSELMEAFLG
jgi:hypothetical protein